MASVVRVNSRMKAWHAERLAKRLIVDAALSMTKLEGAMKRACRLVHVDGKEPHEAAKLVRKDRRTVHRALQTLKPHYDAVRAEVERLTTAPAS